MLYSFWVTHVGKEKREKKLGDEEVEEEEQQQQQQQQQNEKFYIQLSRLSEGLMEFWQYSLH